MRYRSQRADPLLADKHRSGLASPGEESSSRLSGERYEQSYPLPTSNHGEHLRSPILHHQPAIGSADTIRFQWTSLNLGTHQPFRKRWARAIANGCGKYRRKPVNGAALVTDGHGGPSQPESDCAAVAEQQCSLDIAAQLGSRRYTSLLVARRCDLRWCSHRQCRSECRRFCEFLKATDSPLVWYLTAISALRRCVRRTPPLPALERRVARCQRQYGALRGAT